MSEIESPEGYDGPVYLAHPYPQVGNPRVEARVWTDLRSDGSVEDWSTRFEITAGTYWPEDGETVVLTATGYAWEWTEVQWPSGGMVLVGREHAVVHGTREYRHREDSVRRAVADLFGSAIVPYLPGNWVQYRDVQVGDLLTGSQYRGYGKGAEVTSVRSRSSNWADEEEKELEIGMILDNGAQRAHPEGCHPEAWVEVTRA